MRLKTNTHTPGLYWGGAKTYRNPEQPQALNLVYGGWWWENRVLMCVHEAETRLNENGYSAHFNMPALMQNTTKNVGRLQHGQRKPKTREL
jgi:hypothetical protein